MLATRALIAAAGTDKIAPVLTSPQDVALSPTSGRGTVTTDEGNGVLYAVVTTSATKPSAAQIAAGQDHTGSAGAWDGSQGIASTGAKIFNATGLTQSTAYYFHFAQRDRAGNWSSVVSGNGFTTPSADTTAPTLSNPTVGNIGETVATVGCTTNEGSGESGDRIYWVITTSSTQPSKAQVKAGQTHTGAAAKDADSWPAPIGGGVQQQNASGLTLGTNYWAYFMHEDAAGNQSAIVSKAFTTTGGGGGGGVTPGSQNFNISGTFTVPAFNTLTVRVYGAGGGGGGGGIDSNNTAEDGGQSRFNASTALVANGGKGGKGSQAGGAGGAGGTASGGSTNTSGGAGENKGPGLGADNYGGAGGDAPGPSGGDGGNRITAAPSVGAPGDDYGGGGSGGLRNITGGGGGGGGAGAYCTRTYTVGGLTVGANISVVVGEGGGGSNGYLGTATKGGDGADGRVEISWS